MPYISHRLIWTWEMAFLLREPQETSASTLCFMWNVLISLSTTMQNLTAEKKSQGKNQFWGECVCGGMGAIAQKLNSAVEWFPYFNTEATMEYH